jgi:apolipoprotein N-acyltransferase
LHDRLRSLGRRSIRPLAAIASGLLVALAFPHFDLWPLAWCAWVPLLMALEGRSPWRGFGLALLGGATANFVGFFWMVTMLNQFGHLPYWLSVVILLFGAMYQGLSIALAFALSRFVIRYRRWPLWLVLPLFYTGLEYFHPLLFPWFLGNCQYRLLWLIQLSELFGVSALTFLLVMANTVLYGVLCDVRAGRFGGALPRALFAPTALAVLLAAVLGFGAIRVGQVRDQEAAAEALRLGVVEPEIGIFEEQRSHFPPDDSPIWILKWNLLELHRWSRELAEQGVDLLVWPESTFFPALSVYARSWPDAWLAVGTERLQRLSPDLTSLRGNRVPGKVFAATSAGEGRTFLAGADGAIWRVTAQGVLPEESGSTATLRALHVGCSGSVELGDTPQDSCLAMAAGDGGVLLVRSADGWVRLKADLPGDLHALTGLGLKRFLVGGTELVATGTVSDGVRVMRKTPGEMWVAATRRSDRATLLSRKGSRAVVDREGRLTVDGPLPGLGGEVTAAATDENGSLLVATTTGLYRVPAKGAAEQLLDSPLASVACDGMSACAVLGADGTLYRLEGDEAEPAGPTSGTDRALVAIPFARHYWWIPPDATMLYQSERPLPEPMEYPTAVLLDQGTPARDANAVQRGFSVPLLFGATSGVLREVDKPNSLNNTRYNSAFLVDGRGAVKGRYDKQYLLAFGEYIPLGDLFPILYEWSPDSGRFQPGPNDAPLHFKGHRLGVLVCYEDIIPEHTNAVVERGADVLINLTNDAWFGKTKEPYQHFVLAAFRAVEQRRALVRATTTGISGYVSATGEIREMTGLHDAETFVVDVPLLRGETFYRMGGRFFPHLCMALLLGALAAAWERRWRARANRPRA